MEYVDGRTLADFLKEKPSQTEKRQVTQELLEAMSYFHRKQVVHQDLKPSNILITNDGNHVKVIDFGFADSRDYAIIKNPSYSAAYAAPERYFSLRQAYVPDRLWTMSIMATTIPQQPPMPAGHTLWESEGLT